MLSEVLAERAARGGGFISLQSAPLPKLPGQVELAPLGPSGRYRAPPTKNEVVS
jgi:hypothetical protein